MWLEEGNLHTRVVKATDEEEKWLREFLTFSPSEVRYAGKDKLYNPFAQSFPSGVLAKVRQHAAEVDPPIPVEVFDKRTNNLAFDEDADLAWLRDYQRAAVDRVVARRRGILWLPPGAGKTEIAIGMTRALPGKWLFFAHRTTLVHQAVERFLLRSPLESAGVVAEGAWNYSWKLDDFVCASFKTVSDALDRGDKRALDLLHGADAVIVDECFPAGTMVGNQRIEAVRVGDLVPSYDEVSRAFVPRVVTNVWRTEARQLVRLHFASGETLVCTAGHRFLTERGWREAARLGGENVLSGAHGNLSPMRRELRAEPPANLRPEAAWRVLGLLEDLPPETADDGRGARDALRTDDREEPDGVVRERRADGGGSESFGQLAPAGSGGQRSRSDSPADDALRGARSGLVDGARGENWYAAARVQGGPRAPLAEASSGGGRRDAQDEARSGEGREEGPRADFARVDRVEVFEPRDCAERERVCPGGFVYNLQVAGTETYLVGEGGYVAHNCHVLPAESFLRVILETPNAATRIGLSGTPLVRSDRRSALAVAALGPVIYRVKPDLLIERGVLAKPFVKMVVCKQKSLNKTWAGVYRESIVKSPSRNARIIQAVRGAESPCMVFVKDKAHGRALERTLVKNGVPARFVYGDHTVEQRKAFVKELVAGRLETIVASVVFQEGLDIPELRSVIIASGGKSVIAAIQRVGRGMRMSPGKTDFTVIDIADRGCGCDESTKLGDASPRHQGCMWLEKHTRERRAAYLAEGFTTTVEEWP